MSYCPCSVTFEYWDEYTADSFQEDKDGFKTGTQVHLLLSRLYPNKYAYKKYEDSIRKWTTPPRISIDPLEIHGFLI